MCFSQLRICRQPPHILSNGHIYMKDAQCAKTNEKIIFRFMRILFFELWLILFTIFKCFYFNNRPNFFFQKWSNVHERCAMSWSEWKINLFVFEIWSILYWNSEIVYVRGAQSPGPGCLSIESSTQLVLGYHWFAFLNPVLAFKNLEVPISLLTTVEYKMDHISKT